MPKALITIEPSWRFRNAAGQELDPLLFRVLQAINETGKLTAAASRVGYSYRHCWNLIHQWSGFFGVPLVELLKGRGARLTPLGEKLAWAAERVQARLGPQLQNLAVEIDRRYGMSSRCSVLFAPVFGVLSPTDLAAWILDTGIRARLQVQLHKYLWDPQRRGV